MPTAETETDFDPTRDRFRGSLVGLAVGDALGATVEFKKPDGFPRQPVHPLFFIDKAAAPEHHIENILAQRR